MLSQESKDKYLAILSGLKEARAKIFTQKEIATLLEISEGTIKNFESGRLIDFGLVEQYSAICTSKQFYFDVF